ncbi:MAG: hypothetical protein LLG04_07730 [Parachlamydia sp.]|nr:hypothetical protein [Parachlamydia sp.]
MLLYKFRIMNFNTDLNGTNSWPLASAAVSPAIPKIPAAEPIKRKKVCVITGTPADNREAQQELVKRTRRIEEIAFIPLERPSAPRLERDSNAPIRLSTLAVSSDSHENEELAGIVEGYVNSQM